jgi:hypothetical protein
VLDHESVDEPPDAMVGGAADSVTVGAGATDTVTLLLTEPPAPSQVSPYVAFCVSPPVDWLPDMFFEPDHAPLAVHDVAFALDHVNVEDPPEATLVGDAVNVRVGAGAVPTVTVTLRVTLPPEPVQVSVYVEVALSGPTFAEPNVARLPDHAPLAVQLVAFELVHDNCEVPLNATFVGDALNDSVGAEIACAVTVTLSDAVPPAPVHASVNVVVAVIEPDDCVPIVLFVPVHPPLAVHDVASVLVQDNVVDWPDVTELALDVRSTVGAGVVGGAAPSTATLVDVL